MDIQPLEEMRIEALEQWNKDLEQFKSDVVHDIHSIFTQLQSQYENFISLEKRINDTRLEDIINLQQEEIRSLQNRMKIIERLVAVGMPGYD